MYTCYVYAISQCYNLIIYNTHTIYTDPYNRIDINVFFINHLHHFISVTISCGLIQFFCLILQ